MDILPQFRMVEFARVGDGGLTKKRMALQDNLHWLPVATMVCGRPPACNEFLIAITKAVVARLRTEEKYVHHCIKRSWWHLETKVSKVATSLTYSANSRKEKNLSWRSS